MLHIIAVLVFLAIPTVYVAALLHKDKTIAEKAELFNNAVEKIKGYMLDLIFEAEKAYQSGTGQFKKAYVIKLILNGEFYKGLPLFAQKMITYSALSEMVDRMVEMVFNVAKNSNKELQQRLGD